ncbi:cell wall elongation regulator TseB-like domain-containing protein [Bacillus sp. FSL K6-3431]|uniref:cell wall elongation regulator TseB-like domain-containing protein n=1 Tax=Bacillus sp. FSL K6-3431 TaxID=2921500 RepID=UPI0030FC9C51
MKKWILLISSIVLIMAVVSVIVYSKARAPLTNDRNTAEKRAIKEADIVSVDDYYLYNGSNTYHTIIGKNKAGEQLAVWVPENKKQDIVIKKLSDGISEQDAVKKLFTEENPKEILGVRLGMEQDLPIWELAYLDDKSNLNYYYIHFDTGKWWRKIDNL